MTEDQIQGIANRVIDALNNLAPEPTILSSIAPLSPLLAAVLIAWVAWRTLKQKRQSDDRSEWWRRTQWALEAAASEEAVMTEYGNGMLQILADSDMANDEDRLVLDAIWKKSKTHMDPGDIERLILAISERNLTEEQQSSLESYLESSLGSYMDDSPAPGDNRPTKEDGNA